MYCPRCEHPLSALHNCAEEKTNRTFQKVLPALIFCSLLIRGMIIIVAVFAPVGILNLLWEYMGGDPKSWWGMGFSIGGWILTIITVARYFKRREIGQFKVFLSGRASGVKPTCAETIWKRGTDQGGLDVLWFTEGIIHFSDGSSYTSKNSLAFNPIQSFCKKTNIYFKEDLIEGVKKYE